jgi:mono/diheme cytochrome c family protein
MTHSAAETFALVSLVLAASGAAADPASYSRDVRPILAEHCFACHGPDSAARKAKLRLDVRAVALARGAIVPGKPDESKLVTRVFSADPGEIMPPPKTMKQLTGREKETLKRWIADGADYEAHWAFVPPERPPLPAVRNEAWVRNPIDRFVLARLERHGIDPSPEAERTTLIRRLSLDLTGLPPSPGDVEDFLADRSPDAYDKVVSRLLASPHYGERMALPWLDAARYADSNGFQQDGDNYQYVWRDWVVGALNTNLPFDQFTTEQLAGDLLPSPSLDQRVATGFNRCHLLNGEGGAIEEEQRNVIVFDRVDVTATAWLGLTLACAQCHDHKYDPLTRKDYYRLFAYFNNVPETGKPPLGGQYNIADPWVYAGDPGQRAREQGLLAGIESARRQASELEDSPETKAAQGAWERDALEKAGGKATLTPWRAVGPFEVASFDAAYATAFEPEKAIDLTRTYEGDKLKWTEHPEWEDGKAHSLTGNFAATYLYRTIQADRPMPVTLSFGSDDAIKVWLNGAPVLANKVIRVVAPDQEKATVDLRAGQNDLLVKVVNGGGGYSFYFRVAEMGLPDDVVGILKVAPEARTEAQVRRLRAYFVASYPPAPLRAARERLAALERELKAFRETLPRVMVMSDARPRPTHILERGNYLMPREAVEPGTPASLPGATPSAPRNRLGLAQWLVSAENPLTARVQVNRAWQLFFGTGLVKTSENLGTQGEPPVHPELLDWLAVDFREGGWDVKRLHRLIVTSATYRQSSRAALALRERDPENRLLARGARFRLPSLILRDVALASSGLLDQRIGGRPVYPYQPKGIWDGLAITKERDFTYPQSQGADLFRRSLYTFWRRTVAPGNMFDAS